MSEKDQKKSKSSTYFSMGKVVIWETKGEIMDLITSPNKNSWSVGLLVPWFDGAYMRLVLMFNKHDCQFRIKPHKTHQIDVLCRSVIYSCSILSICSESIQLDKAVSVKEERLFLRSDAHNQLP